MKLWPEHLEPLARHLFDDRRVVQEPPAAERHEIGELARVDAELVLILAAEDADQEAHVGPVAAQPFDDREVGLPDGVARQSKRRVHLPPDADHQRHRQSCRLARGQHGVAASAACARRRPGT